MTPIERAKYALREASYPDSTLSLVNEIAAQIAEAEREAIDKHRGDCDGECAKAFASGFTDARERAVRLAFDTSEGHLDKPCCARKVADRIRAMEPTK